MAEAGARAEKRTVPPDTPTPGTNEHVSAPEGAPRKRPKQDLPVADERVWISSRDSQIQYKEYKYILRSEEY